MDTKKQYSTLEMMSILTSGDCSWKARDIETLEEVTMGYNDFLKDYNGNTFQLTKKIIDESRWRVFQTGMNLIQAANVVKTGGTIVLLGGDGKVVKRVTSGGFNNLTVDEIASSKWYVELPEPVPHVDPGESLLPVLKKALLAMLKQHEVSIPCLRWCGDITSVWCGGESSREQCVSCYEKLLGNIK